MENGRQELLEGLKVAKDNGYRAFVSKRGCYGWIVTEENILYVQINWRGWDFSFEYMPSRNIGSGCACNLSKQPIGAITIDIINKMERDGMAFAKELGAKRYANPMDFFNKHWDIKNICEV